MNLLIKALFAYSEIHFLRKYNFICWHSCFLFIKIFQLVFIVVVKLFYWRSHWGYYVDNKSTTRLFSNDLEIERGLPIKMTSYFSQLEFWKFLSIMKRSKIIHIIFNNWKVDLNKLDNCSSKTHFKEKIMKCFKNTEYLRTYYNSGLFQNKIYNIFTIHNKL